MSVCISCAPVTHCFATLGMKDMVAKHFASALMGNWWEQAVMVNLPVLLVHHVCSATEVVYLVHRANVTKQHEGPLSILITHCPLNKLKQNKNCRENKIIAWKKDRNIQ